MTGAEAETEAHRLVSPYIVSGKLGTADALELEHQITYAILRAHIQTWQEANNMLHQMLTQASTLSLRPLAEPVPEPVSGVWSKLRTSWIFGRR